MTGVVVVEELFGVVELQSAMTTLELALQVLDLDVGLHETLALKHLGAIRQRAHHRLTRLAFAGQLFLGLDLVRKGDTAHLVMQLELVESIGLERILANGASKRTLIFVLVVEMLVKVGRDFALFLADGASEIAE